MPQNPSTPSGPAGPEETSGKKARNGNGYPIFGLNGDTPWWARFVLVILFSFGVPTLIVGLLFAMGAGWIPSPITETAQVAREMRTHIRLVRKAERAQATVLLLICQHSAFTQAQQVECHRTIEEYRNSVAAENSRNE